MRAIKFRFFDFKENKMFCGFDHCSLDYVLSEWEQRNRVSQPMQFTGLKDKNGKEIYEGDLLKSTQHGQIGKVYWSTDGYLVVWIEEHYDSHLRKCEDCEIIGNIHEHPHLQEGKINAKP